MDSGHETLNNAKLILHNLLTPEETLQTTGTLNEGWKVLHNIIMCVHIAKTWDLTQQTRVYIRMAP
jgi:hypothetical protein